MAARCAGSTCATVLGAALDAERVEIWTDVDGVLTAPPHIVSNASRISRLSYEEAAELSYFGATVLHRRTVEPLVGRGIPRFCSALDRMGTPQWRRAIPCPDHQP